MTKSKLPFLLLTSLAMLLPHLAGADEAPITVRTLRAPDGGIQPQALSDAKGTIHLIYYKGDPRSGDLYYTSKAKGAESFARPMQVNSPSGKAIAAGSVRGVQMALGKNGRIHAVWNGSGKPTEAVFYSRMTDDGKGFEKEKNLIGSTWVMDGGCSVAADTLGQVHVVWHALGKTTGKGEANRKIWVAHSTDEGKTFSRETPAWSQETGVCPCCSLKAFASKEGAVQILYRSAIEGMDRDIYLLSSKDKGQSFQGKEVHKWRLPL
ncbi:MAG: exo-alpha-sialidase [Gemmataceae bacterium]|nr:exo-alpha-sialidase [Gemmataceae bacterium]